MPNESVLSRLEQLLSEIVTLGGQKEQTSIVPNMEVIDNAPTDLTGYIIIEDSRDGDYITCRSLPGIVYNIGDLVNVIFIEGTEPIAFQQGSGSGTATNLWQLVGGTGPDIYYNNGEVGIGVTIPLAELHVNQSDGLGSIPALILNQLDESEQCIEFSSDGNDRDIIIYTVDVTDTPTHQWDESEDEFLQNKGLAISSGNLSVADDIIHYGDSDTYIQLNDDQMTFFCGNLQLLELTEAGQDQVTIGVTPSGTDIDINFNGTAFIEVAVGECL